MTTRLALTILAALAITAAPAKAAGPPVLLTVTSNQMHPAATFQAAGGGFVTIDFATSPARATDGEFLKENLAKRDFLTDSEIATGKWTDDGILPPGRYWVKMNSIDFDCPDEPCVEGDSNVLELVVPKPAQRYTTSVRVLRNLRTVYLTLRVSPLGEKLPYRVCWKTTRDRQRCVRATVPGFSWTDPGEDSVTILLRDMRRRTTFRWVAGDRTVATRTVRT